MHHPLATNLFIEMIIPMKTIVKIDPEKEYQNAKNILASTGQDLLDTNSLKGLDSSIENLITVARVLIEREEKRRGKKKNKIPKENKPKKGRKKGQERKEVKKLPSERYPNLEIKEKTIYPSHTPDCPCCGSEMKLSGLFDITEKLETIPKKYYIQRYKRPKFNCGKCHGAIVNTAALASIIPSSNYGDSLVIDATLSKFCDLIPMERYTQIAFRADLMDIPAQSLIGLTHHLADFMYPVYDKIKTEVLSDELLLADETTHKMLEGDDTQNWYLWGFFNKRASYFEAHGTRSGDVALEFLKRSSAKYLMSDGYSGYNKAAKILKKEFNREVLLAGCNAHAIRYFKDASERWKEECAPFLKIYGDIYELEKQIKSFKSKDDEKALFRRQMLPLFAELKRLCENELPKAMPNSYFAKALKYFLNQYDGLILCTSNLSIPLDNNHSEREVRPSVVGRKTWYGTHSKRGAETLQIHFSIVGSCKVNNVNPRKYYPWVVDQIHQGKEILTPYQYSKL
jgi:transposase